MNRRIFPPNSCKRGNSHHHHYHRGTIWAMEAIRTVPSTIWMWSLRLMLLLCGWWGYGWWWYDLGDGGHNDHVDEVFRVRVFFLGSRWG